MTNKLIYLDNNATTRCDEEVLQAAIDTNFMGYAYALKLNDSGIDKDIVIEMAREDPKVIAQIERNRNK